MYFVHNLFLKRPTMKDLLLLFGVTLAKRCTKKQKSIFYSQAVPYFQKLGFAVEIQEAASKVNQASNVIIGDMKKAKKIVLCPYDTPTKSIIPFKYYPFNLGRNFRQENVNLLLSFFIYAAVGGLLFFFLNHFSVFNPSINTIGTILLALLLFFSTMVIGGIPNPVNFNKNSASVALIASLAQERLNIKDTCFILLDKNTINSSGLKMLTKDESLQNKILVYLDCLAFGEKMACIHKKDSDLEAKKLIASLPRMEILEKVIGEDRGKDTNLQFFPKMIHICTGTIEKDWFLVRNTRSKKDFQVDMPRLEKIRDGLLMFLKG